ncbi:MAG: btuE [Chitinophagaceae bacterium]|nr:btuE [Chitinophagaceae bacterium]
MKHQPLFNMTIMGLGYSFLMFLSSCFGSIKSNPSSSGGGEKVTAKEDFYAIKVKTLDGKDFDLHQLKGKKILIINTASECGFTPQYEDLEALNLKYGNKVVLLGFPCNDFGGQEPGSPEKIQNFCSTKFHTTFQLMEKVEVKGANIHPLYKWLTDPAKNGWNDKAPSWNFCKYLIDENGQLLKFYPSAVKPLSADIVDAL